MRDNLLRAALLLAALPSGFAFAGGPAMLSVYIEDTHTGSYYWMIQNLSLQRDYQLVLIDAHSDASAILGSDAIRQRVMDSAGSDQLEPLIRQWRSKGTIQCYDWIEPLMPHPITKVWWIPAESLTNAEIARKQQEVRAEIDAHQEAAPRQDGEFGDKYEIADLNHFLWSKLEGPVVVTVDLDYFADQSSAEEIRRKLSRILNSVLQISDLRAITFSISRPYLASREQADQLLFEALRYTTRVVNAEIHYEPFEDTGVDRSEKAKELHRQHLELPRYEVEGAPPELRTLLLQNASRIIVNHESQRWEALLERWRQERFAPSIRLWVNGRKMKEDTKFTFAAGQSYQLQVETPKILPRPRIRWMILSAEHSVYNLTGADEKFAAGAPKYIVDREEAVEAADDNAVLDGKQLTPFFDKKTGLGTLRVYGEVRLGKNIYLSSVVRLTRYQGNGYPGKLTEIFNLPYVYGSALLSSDGQSSADARQGADCSHFIIYDGAREPASPM